MAQTLNVPEILGLGIGLTLILREVEAVHPVAEIVSKIETVPELADHEIETVFVDELPLIVPPLTDH